MLVRWFLTVFSDTNSRSAMLAIRSPAASSTSTSRSRSVRSSGRLDDRAISRVAIFDAELARLLWIWGQGELDGDLVPSEAIFNALERLGKHVEYRVYAGESHVITQPANVIDFWERRLEFLAEHLRLDVDEKGRVSPARR